ncbi:IbrB-like domain-containing protein [Photobacterium indicum]|uniref:IbrB-like domain-containing protein n=1 Tax=Photobacterium indicum TaxID=81447 RepID=UPI003D0C300E
MHEKIIQLLMCANKDNPSIEERVETFNLISTALYHYLGIHHPVLNVQLIPSVLVEANDYNPNVVAPPEYRLLTRSIESDGLTLPIVVGQDPDGKYEIIDGFHRTRIIKEDENISASTRGYVPVVLLDKELEQRMSSTVRHNMARGEHQVTLTAELIRRLKNSSWKDEEIAKELGMDLDEVLRMKQVTGLAELFKNDLFSMAWE